MPRRGCGASRRGVPDPWMPCPPQASMTRFACTTHALHRMTFATLPTGDVALQDVSCRSESRRKSIRDAVFHGRPIACLRGTRAAAQAPTLAQVNACFDTLARRWRRFDQPCARRWPCGLAPLVHRLVIGSSTVPVDDAPASGLRRRSQTCAMAGTPVARTGTRSRVRRCAMACAGQAVSAAGIAQVAKKPPWIVRAAATRRVRLIHMFVIGPSTSRVDSAPARRAARARQAPYCAKSRHDAVRGWRRPRHGPPVDVPAVTLAMQ